MPQTAHRAEDSAESDRIESEERHRVERDRSDVQRFVNELSGDDIKSGGCFTKLLAHSLSAYSKKVDWQYFQAKYKGVAADTIVGQRIKMASRNAAIEGGLSASAYTATVTATIGSLGGASPATVPAAIATKHDGDDVQVSDAIQ